MWLAMDAFRRMQGDALDAFGFGPIECPYSVLASDTRWVARRKLGDLAIVRQRRLEA